MTGGNNDSTTFSGLLSGSSLLTKTGAGTLTLVRPGGNTKSGGVTISGGTLLVANTSGSATGTATVTVNSGAKLGGTGTISGNVTNSGTVAPGNSAGTLHLGGSYTQSASGRLEIDLASTSSYDALAVTGSASLAGTLAVSLLGYMPHDGDVFQILSASGRGGTFTTTSLPALSGELFWNVNYSANSVSLAVAAAGDFNGDGAVDAADYVVFRKGAATPFGPLDYDVWRTNFGQSYSSGLGVGASASVPEPATMVLLIFATLGWCLRRGRVA